MKFDELFEQKSLVASKLKVCLRDKGYTKVSFAKKTEISCSTLDKFLNGNIDDKATFDRHLQKIIKMLNMSADELMTYSVYQNGSVTTVYPRNAPKDYEMSDKAKKQYNLLMDIIDLCTIYY